MAKSFKIVVTGPFNSGKTAFISTISEIDVVSTERRVTTLEHGIKTETTVAMDYGRITIGDAVIHLNGTPGQARFDFMWEILATEMDGFILLVDSSNPATFPAAGTLARHFVAFKNVPYIVVANKMDLSNTASLEQVRMDTNTDDAITVMPCVGTRKTSVRQVLLQIIDLITNGKMPI